MSQVMNPVLMAAVDATTPNAALLQSVTEIGAYSQLMATTATPSTDPVSAVLIAAKTHAAQWYDSIYPAYLNMPSTIAIQGDTIDGGLATLVQVAGQFATSPSDALRAAVDSQASGLATTVGNIEGQTSGLASGLGAFATNLQGDSAALHVAVTTVTNEINVLTATLTALYGQMQQLRQATCPSSGDIEACAQATAQSQQQLQTLQGDLPTVTAAATAASNALAGLSYLNGFWGAVTKDAQACLAALARMQADPSAAVATDLAQTQQLWTALRQQFGSLTTQIAAM